MITVEQAKQKPVVTASATKSTQVWGTGTNDGVIFRLSTPLTKNGYSKGDKIGVIVDVYPFKEGSYNLARVQLLKPVTVGLSKYTHGFVFLAEVDLFGTQPVSSASMSKTYYCIGNSVNVRKGASTTADKYSYQLNKGDIIGYSDGVETNGFYKFLLQTGDIGYVSKTYCSLQPPAQITTQVVDKKSGQTVTVPVLPENKSQLDITKTVIGAAAGAVAAYLVTKIIQLITKS